MAAQRIELCRCLQSELPDFLRALTLSLPNVDSIYIVPAYLRSLYFRIIYHIRSPYWEGDRLSQRAAGLIWQRNPDGEMRRETEEGKRKRRDGERGLREKSLDFEN